MKKKVSIRGMSCQHCVARVKKALESAGAKDVEVNLELGYAQFEGGSLSQKAIVDLIEDAGYDVIQIEQVQ